MSFFFDQCPSEVSSVNELISFPTQKHSHDKLVCNTQQHMASLQSLRKPTTYLRWPLLLIPLLLIFILYPSKAPPSTLRTLPEESSPACPSTRPLTVFLHLHKTGGNTIKKTLFAFAKRNNLQIHHTCHSSTSDTLLKRWYFHRKKDENAMDCNLDTVLDTPPTLDFIVGHQFLGAHSLFPNRDVRYFTFMREPLRRKVSHFLHFEKGPDAQLFTYLIEQNRNYMTKRLATDAVTGEIISDLRSRFMDIEVFASRAALRAAKRNLVERFFFVGLQERFGESACVLSKILNIACGIDGRLAKKWQLSAKKMVRGSENIRGQAAQRLKRLPRLVRQAARRAEAVDIELYKFAKMLFERKLSLYPECRS